MTASSTIQENPVNLSHLLRNTCPLFLLLVLLMETKQFNFVCANVLLWRDVARKKKKNLPVREEPATPFQTCWCYWEKELGVFSWGQSLRSVEGFYAVSYIGGEREFLLIKQGSLVSRCGGLSFCREVLMDFSGPLRELPRCGQW